MENQEIALKRDCQATLIPAGDVVVLKQGSNVYVTQALGGSVTVRNEMGLYRINSNDLDALGDGTWQSNEKTTRINLNESFSEDLVWQALKTCFDPEIPVNIVDLGLIYDLKISLTDNARYTVDVKMTLTAQGCGMGPTIAADAKQKIEQLEQVQTATVDIVWDPVWSPQMISEDGRVALGLN